MDSDLIKLVNKLQDTFNNLGGELDMPQIIVVGSQSAGKSSVLETIVGRDFLPRGQGIVTRRPLVLQLIHTPGPSEVSDAPESSSQPPEYAQFLHLDRTFTSFADVRAEIEQETFRVAGQNKGISKLPISLRIYSPNVLDLTLVDLPGLTKIPVGDQPSDIEKQIRSLVVDYISKPNSVILAISPANTDLANSDALKLARSVDPAGRRTIGVLTKLDLMDAGTNALDILTGRVYPLKLGFIGVVNRSQLDITTNRSMAEAREKEDEFFRTHPAYRAVRHKNGTAYLAKTLNQVLLNHIRDKLPDMKARLNTLMGQTQQELNAFGDSAAFGDINAQSALVLRLMTQFARDFVSSIEGTNVDISTKELSGGARIYYIFNDVFGAALGSIDPTSSSGSSSAVAEAAASGAFPNLGTSSTTTGGLSDQDIRTAIRNSTGPRPSLFVPEVAFDLLVKPQIKLLEGPALRCVEMVYEELVRICHNCTSAELQRFPRLHAQIIEVVSELLRERLGPTSEYAQSLIEIQAAYINTNHPSFLSAQNMGMGPPAGSQSTNRDPPPRPSSAEPFGNNALDDDDDEHEASDGEGSINGIFPPREGRSVSSTVHNRSRTSNSVVPSSAPKSRHSHHHSHPRPHSAIGQTSTSPPTARETFLTYFFGSGAQPSSGNQGIMPTGRDVEPASTAHLGGLLAGKRSLEGSNSAFDMKSLGKHIEAVPVSSPTPTSREALETALIRSLIGSYFSIVRQSVQDLIPKAIMHFLVNHTSQHVQNRLVAQLYKPDLFAEMLNEDETIVAERTRVKALLDAYKEAFRTLSDIGMKPS